MIAETLYENGVTVIVRNPGLPISECWSALGNPSLKFSNRSVAEETAKGVLSVNGNNGRLSETFLKSKQREARSESGKKAAETRRKSPLSASGVLMLQKIDNYGDWFFPEHWRDLDLLRECFSKGFVLWGEFKTPRGKVKGYLLTGSGKTYLNSRLVGGPK